MGLDDMFYDVRVLDLENRRALLCDAVEVCSSWNVDILDCSVSIARQTIEMSFEDILAKLDDSCHFVFIHRNGIGEIEDHLEVGFSTSNLGVAYFLFMYCDIDKTNELASKYNLEPVVWNYE